MKPFTVDATPELQAKFWSKVQKLDDDSCWEWTGCRINTRTSGYGQFRLPCGKRVLAHRVSLFLSKGEFDASLDVMHSCDNPPCCNPAHLSAGTRKDNLEDAAKKGRMAHGEEHWLSVLTAEQVAEIRNTYRRGVIGHRHLSEKYGVNVSTIHAVLSGKTWGRAGGDSSEGNDPYQNKPYCSCALPEGDIKIMNDHREALGINKSVIVRVVVDHFCSLSSEERSAILSKTFNQMQFTDQ